MGHTIGGGCHIVSLGCEIASDRNALVYEAAPRFRPLWTLASVAELKGCYAGIVETQFRAYERGILHRDISDNTVLWHRSSDGKAVGCLLDWDLSYPIHYDVDNEATNPLNRRGTSPFTGLDLQYIGSDGKHFPQTHRYHHDLESFFWLLLWAIVHYDFERKCRLLCRFPGWIEDWCKRQSFMYSFHTRREYLSLTLESSEDLRKRWLWPLFKLFSGARNASLDMDQEGLDFFNEGRYGELVTFETFTQMIKIEPNVRAVHQARWTMATVI